MVISTTLSGAGQPPPVGVAVGETLPTFGRAPYLPWEDILTPQAGLL
jgi:hypothetical protein